MPFRGSFSMKGYDEYLAKIEKAGKDVDESARRAVDAGAQVIRAGMDRRAPVGETGELKKNIKVFYRKSAGNFHIAMAGVDLGKNLPDYGNPGTVAFNSIPKAGQAQSYRKTWGRERLYMIYVEYGRSGFSRKQNRRYKGLGARPYATPTIKSDTRKAWAAVKKSLIKDSVL